jgi:cytosine deaminase
MWILNTRIPSSLLLVEERVPPSQLFSPHHPDDIPPNYLPDCVKVHLQISPTGTYQHIQSADRYPSPEQLSGEAVMDQKGGILLPCFVDVHAHLDKGQIWPRTPNPDGSFAGAMAAVTQDAERYWTEEDLYRRMSFGLRCSYAHGTQAIRTHLDSSGALGQRVWRVFQHLRQEWSDRLTLEAVALVPPDYYGLPNTELSAELETLLETVASNQGILGGVFFADPQVSLWLDRLFTLAQAWGLSLDLHVDESNHPQDRSLLAIAQAKLRHHFSRPVVCGHCCSLSLQSPPDLEETIAVVKAAGIGIVSLPLCNLYLQDRQAQHTPRWRGVTALHELKQAGVSLALASDNCRDPFYAFGDHDGLEVLRESTRIAHLDHPFGDWITAVTRTPAAWMDIESRTVIQPGAPAHFILFKGRSWNELLSRPESDRRVFRAGVEIQAKLPSYGELYDLD